jgi:hypothetical protein
LYHLPVVRAFGGPPHIVKPMIAGGTRGGLPARPLSRGDIAQADIGNLDRPLSHASLVAAFIEGRWPRDGGGSDMYFRSASGQMWRGPARPSRLSQFRWLASLLIAIASLPCALATARAAGAGDAVPDRGDILAGWPHIWEWHATPHGKIWREEGGPFLDRYAGWQLEGSWMNTVAGLGSRFPGAGNGMGEVSLWREKVRMECARYAEQGWAREP